MATRKDFVEDITKVLTQVGFKEKETEKWELVRTGPGSTTALNLDGHNRTITSPGPTIEFLVTTVGNGEIDKKPMVQVLWEVYRNNEFVYWYEEGLHYDDIDRFKALLYSIIQN